jgi:hypothetical protein
MSVVISVHDYNKARDILAAAGSMTARKSHQKHGTDVSPDAHGQSLLREARDEFNKLPEPLRTLKRAEVVKAAKQMNITQW